MKKFNIFGKEFYVINKREALRLDSLTWFIKFDSMNLLADLNRWCMNKEARKILPDLYLNRHRVESIYQDVTSIRNGINL